MRIIARRALKEFWEKHAQAEQPLKSWYEEARLAMWSSPHEIKTLYRSADIIGDNRVVFNISGNKYRLIVKINYAYQIILVRFIGIHAEYDKIKAETIL